MSNATVDLIRRYYAAFNAGDWDGMLGCLSEDVVHDIVVMATESGDRGSAEFVVHGEYLATDEGLPPANGQKYVLPAGAFFDIRDGRITRVTNYYNLPNWTAQVVGP